MQRALRDNTPRARAMTAARDRRPSSATALLFSTTHAADNNNGNNGFESFRYPSHLPPPSRTASHAASSVRTPFNSDMDMEVGIGPDRAFDPRDVASFRLNGGPVGRTSAAGRALHLTREENDKLRTLASSLLADVITAYETHVHVNNRHADPSHWKLVKKRDHLVAYKQKQQKNWSKKIVGQANQNQTSAAEALPTMMAFGSIAGQLDDVLYGFLSETSLEIKLQGSYASGTIHDAAVLSVLDAASLEEPFQFTGVKWVCQSFGAGGTSSSSKTASAKTLLKRRGLMYLESIGVMPMESGELLGYRILHSVNFKSMAHLHDHAVRAKLSMCQLYRQRSDGKTVDVFMRGYFDPSGGRVSQLLATSLSADMMLTAPGDALECANLKKLTWCAKQSGRRRRKWTAIIRQTRKNSAAEMEEMRMAAQELGLNADGDNDASSTSCALCRKECSGLLRRSACACMVCSQLVCTRCSVSKKLSFVMGPSDDEDSVSSTEEIRQKALSFCLHCIVASNRERAFDIAVSDLLERGVSAGPPPVDRYAGVPSAGRITPANRTHSGRARPSSVSHQQDERPYAQLLPTPSSAGRRRATTTTATAKRLTTILTFDGLMTSSTAATASTRIPPARIPHQPHHPHRGKAFSVASGATTNSSSQPDAEEVD